MNVNQTVLIWYFIGFIVAIIGWTYSIYYTSIMFIPFLLMAAVALAIVFVESDKIFYARSRV